MCESKKQGVVAQPLDEIAFDKLKAADTLLIQTQHSTYSFSVSDPTLHRGVLSGGSFGDQPLQAILLNLPTEEGDSAKDCHPLGVGERFVFLIESSHGLVSSLTSAVKKIQRIMPKVSRRLASETLSGETLDGKQDIG